MTYLNDNRSAAEHNRIIFEQLAANGLDADRMRYRHCKCCGKLYRGRATQVFCSSRCGSMYREFGGPRPTQEPKEPMPKRKSLRPRTEKIESYDYDCGFDDFGLDDFGDW